MRRDRMRCRSFKALCPALLITLLPLPVSAAVGGGDITFPPKGAATVVFQHALHVNRKGLTCTNCHDKPFQKKSGESLYQMDMGILTKGQFCGSCHNGATAFDVKDEKSCSRCHRD